MAIEVVNPRFYYAPFTSGQIRLWTPGVTKIGPPGARPHPTNAWVKFGQLEENSKIGLAERTVGPDHDSRYIGNLISVEAFDIEAMLTTEANFLRFQNCEVEFAANLYGGGFFVGGPLRYYMRYDPLAQRGFRFVHRLTGEGIWPNIVMYGDADYNTVRSYLGLPLAGSLTGTAKPYGASVPTKAKS